LINNVHGPPVDGMVHGRQLGTGKPKDRGRVGGQGCAQRAACGCKRGRTEAGRVPPRGAVRRGACGVGRRSGRHRRESCPVNAAGRIGRTSCPERVARAKPGRNAGGTAGEHTSRPSGAGGVLLGGRS